MVMSLQLFKHVKILTSWLGLLGVSCLIASPALSQSYPPTRDNTSLNGTAPFIRATPGMSTPNSPGTYPYGSRLDASGIISTPRGVTLPSVRINNGDGSTTYYYPNGSRVTVDRQKIPPSGAYLR